MGKNELNDERTYSIIGAAMEVHKILGCGFSELVYQEAFEHELTIRKIPYIKEKCFNVKYKDINIKKFRVDFECYGEIIVELKAVEDLGDKYYIQTYNYLKASDYKVALLINFGNTSLEYRKLTKKERWK